MSIVVFAYLYSDGVIPNLSLNILEKWYWLLNPVASAISEMVRLASVRSCDARRSLWSIINCFGEIPKCAPNSFLKYTSLRLHASASLAFVSDGSLYCAFIILRAGDSSLGTLPEPILCSIP